MKKIIALLMGLTVIASAFTACGEKNNSSDSSDIQEASDISEADDDEDYTTGDASLDNIRNQDEIGENELLVISFGTSFNDNRRLTIGAIEDSLEKAFPDYSVRRGFTANIVIDHINRRDGFLIDDVEAALKRAESNGVKTLVVQPTHLMNGFEYNDLIKAVGNHADSFDKVVFGEPLLTSDDDFKRVEQAIVGWTKEYDDGKTAICFMGHGTETESNAVYQKMQNLLTADGHTNYFVGTVGASPSLEDVIASVKAGNYERVILEPLMVVAGDHAHNDMAGDEEDSWKSAFEAEGYEVECLLRGLGENEAIRQIYIDHAQAAIDSISEKSESQHATVSPEEVGYDGMQAIGADSLNAGEYHISVDSSSSMFKIADCILKVDEDKNMTADIMINSKSYDYLFMGTGEQALADGGENFISYTVNDAEQSVFTVSVEALDKEIQCAALSAKKQEWYDRTLVFRADSLPDEAFSESRYNTVESLGISDGDYTVEVTLEGGSGHTSVQSPAKLTVKDGTASAEIIFSSNKYDYVVVSGEKYLPVSMEENSIFEIPVTGFDYKMPISADTIAMSQPYEIEYTLYFDSETIR